MTKTRNNLEKKHWGHIRQINVCVFIWTYTCRCTHIDMYVYISVCDPMVFNINPVLSFNTERQVLS